LSLDAALGLGGVQALIREMPSSSMALPNWVRGTRSLVFIRK
jgi:hypothetical protein